MLSYTNTIMTSENGKIKSSSHLRQAVVHESQFYTIKREIDILFYFFIHSDNKLIHNL